MVAKMIAKANNALLLGAAWLAIAVTPALCDAWSYKRGLWAEDYSGEFAKANPLPAARFCIPADTPTLIMQAPAPLMYKSETCKESVVSKSRTGQEIQRACGPSGTIREQRHFVVKGKFEEVDREEITEGSPGNLLIKTLHWVGANCADASVRSGSIAAQ
jgi:hypothetical protein